MAFVENLCVTKNSKMLSLIKPVIPYKITSNILTYSLSAFFNEYNFYIVEVLAYVQFCMISLSPSY